MCLLCDRCISYYGCVREKRKKVGRPDQPLKATVDYAGQDLKPGTDYYLIAFGYEGTATTPLFKQQVRTSGEPDSGWPGDDGGWADFGE